MSSTSQKRRNFVSAPMRWKPVTDLAGIGPVLGRRLVEAGFAMATNVLGKFLILNEDEYLFKNWLRELTKANDKQSNDCYTCLREWCGSHL